MGRADEFDSRVIEEGDHVPEHIPSFCLEQEASLADSKLRRHPVSGSPMCCYIRWCVTHLGLCPNGPHARVFGILQPLILVTRFELSQRGPRLP